ncbi:uncharacterized protein LOC112051784 [Bicyclus anynana]|uniref:Uncharacterized protein LOC112051784 n=1 Tax=Bicyclus anynana TaxID=110368 RepID=A0A6J1NMW7_BICAN|nr:uncharacterized protein LOC112051784 [Bicyclus anynana]
MHIAQVGFVKGRNVVHTISKNTSCNSGWLRLVVQTIFGTLIVSSFVLIMLMVVGKPTPRPPSASRCSVTNCRVVCTNAPYYGDYEEDIINAASDADVLCESIALKLIGPTFKNFQIPSNWLWSMNPNVRELAIYGGNLKQISSDAFMSPFGRNIKLLILEEIEINVWEKDMLIGLSSLEKLILRDCILLDIRKAALSPFHDSLKFLEIKANNYYWDPINVTGSTTLAELTIVDFSTNNFHDFLGNTSFSQLNACEVLFLNDCHITSLNPGTFDYMESLEILYLNNNLLVTVPVGLFDRMLPYQPRIALQDNLWHCECSRKDIRHIVRKELLIVDPICHTPATIAGMTFTDFEGYCEVQQQKDESVEQRISKSNPEVKVRSNIMYMNGACHENISSEVNQATLRVKAISEDQQNCLLNRINFQDMQTVSNNSNGHLNDNWIKPVFFVENDPYSMVEITSIALPGYGLLWYQSTCADTIYCVNTVPHTLKVFNVHLENFLTFCPFNLSSGAVMISDCLSYNLANIGINRNHTYHYHELIWFISLSVGCLLCGAICVYGMIHKNPTLLKGSKRVLIVKHRSVDALILPPKVPIRNLKTESNLATDSNIFANNKIFILPNKQTLTSPNFDRSISIKSNVSNDATYISALQPTEEQLTEWRSKQVDTFSSDFSMIPYTSMYEKESLPYYSFDKEERVYEVPK